MEIMKVGVIAIIYYFIIIILYVTLSSPFDDMMTSFEDLDLTASDSHIETNTALGRTVWDICFAGLALVPALWMAVYLLRREPHWGYGP